MSLSLGIDIISHHLITSYNKSHHSSKSAAAAAATLPPLVGFGFLNLVATHCEIELGRNVTCYCNSPSIFSYVMTFNCAVISMEIKKNYAVTP
jgi:hypothetical protein